MDEIAAIVGGELLRGDGSKTVREVTTDSRADCEGKLFVPLIGERFDGHDFVAGFAEKGGAAAVVSKEKGLEGAPESFGVIRVGDTLRALQDIARHNRLLRKIPVVAVTGSAGKTTTKEMLGAILRRTMKAVVSEKNFNNEIGVPLTLLGMENDAEVLALEFGMRGLGQIAELADIARPTIGAITNVGNTHIGQLGSEEAIAQAKGELFEALPADGVAVVNRDNAWAAALEKKAKCKILTVGLDAANDFSASNIRLDFEGVNFVMKTPSGSANVRLSEFGRINVHNALCAAAAAWAAGVPLAEIAAGLAETKTSGHRMTRIKGLRGSTLIDDAYNSNPASLGAQIASLAEIDWPGRRALILGDMLELEPIAEQEHRRIGGLIDSRKFGLLVGFGSLARNIVEGAVDGGFKKENAFCCEDYDEAAKALPEMIREGDLVLIKGSRGMRMERFVGLLTEETP